MKPSALHKPTVVSFEEAGKVATISVRHADIEFSDKLDRLYVEAIAKKGPAHVFAWQAYALELRRMLEVRGAKEEELPPLPETTLSGGEQARMAVQAMIGTKVTAWHGWEKEDDSPCSDRNERGEMSEENGIWLIMRQEVTEKVGEAVRALATAREEAIKNSPAPSPVT